MYVISHTVTQLKHTKYSLTNKRIVTQLLALSPVVGCELLTRRLRYHRVISFILMLAMLSSGFPFDVFHVKTADASQNILHVIVLKVASSSPWIVLSDWNNNNNTIVVVGPVGNDTAGGSTAVSSGAGGGDTYTSTTNLNLTGSSTVSFVVGGGGSGAASWFSSQTLAKADAGGNASGATAGTAGTVAAGTGTAGDSCGIGVSTLARGGNGGGGDPR